MKQSFNKLIDRHDAPDIFCDGVLAISVRHDVCRITLHSDRIDAVDGKSINRVVIGHLSMSPPCFVDFYNRMTGIIEQLKRAGVVQAEIPRPLVS